MNATFHQRSKESIPPSRSHKYSQPQQLLLRETREPVNRTEEKSW